MSGAHVSRGLIAPFVVGLAGSRRRIGRGPRGRGLSCGGMSPRPLRLLGAAVCAAVGVIAAVIGGFGTLASAFDDSRDNDLWVYIVFGLG